MEDDDALANRPGPGAWPLTRLVLAQGLPAASTINDSASLRKDEHTQRTAAARASLAKISPRPPFSPKRLEPRTRCHPTGWPLPLIPSEIQARTHTHRDSGSTRASGQTTPAPSFFFLFFFSRASRAAYPVPPDWLAMQSSTIQSASAICVVPEVGPKLDTASDHKHQSAPDDYGRKEERERESRRVKRSTRCRRAGKD